MARSPFIRCRTSAGSVLSPQRSRCSPRIHRSPAAGDGVSGRLRDDERRDGAVVGAGLEVEQPVELAVGEADQVEVEAEVVELGELEVEEFLIPA